MFLPFARRGGFPELRELSDDSVCAFHGHQMWFHHRVRPSTSLREAERQHRLWNDLRLRCQTSTTQWIMVCKPNLFAFFSLEIIRATFKKTITSKYCIKCNLTYVDIICYIVILDRCAPSVDCNYQLSRTFKQITITFTYIQDELC